MMKEKEALINDLTAQVDSAGRKASGAQSEKASIESRMMEMGRERDSLKQRLTDMEMSLADTQKALAQKAAEPGALPAELAASPEISAKIGELEKAAAQSSARIDSLQKKLKFAEERLAKMSAVPQKEGQEEASGDISSLLKEKENTIMDLMEERDILETDFSGAKKKNSDLEKRLAEKEAELKKAKEEINSAMEMYVIEESR
jgi:chromosome segregation ATPase